MDNHSEPEKTPQEVLKDARKQITRSAIFAIAALVVIVFACYAWFVSTKNVSANLNSVRIARGPFDLASVGEGGVYDNKLDIALQVTGAEWVDPQGQKGTSTEKNDSVLWRVSESSSLNNFGTSGKRGIQPGSFGTLQFYVIPHKDGNLLLNFQLELVPLDTAMHEIQDNPTLVNLLKGHLLFYQGESDSPQWVNCDSGSFSMEFQDAKAETPVLVTLQWKWPYLLEVVKSENDVVACMEKYPQDFFYNPDGEIPQVDLTNSYGIFDSYFNAADEYIGTMVTGIFLRLSADVG